MTPTELPAEAFGSWTKERREQYFRPEVAEQRGNHVEVRLVPPKGWKWVECERHDYAAEKRPKSLGYVPVFRCLRCGHRKGSKFKRDRLSRTWAPCVVHDLALPHTVGRNLSDEVRCVECGLSFGRLVGGPVPAPLPAPRWVGTMGRVRKIRGRWR